MVVTDIKTMYLFHGSSKRGMKNASNPNLNHLYPKHVKSRRKLISITESDTSVVNYDKHGKLKQEAKLSC